MQIAILADVHLNDIYTGYGRTTTGAGTLTLRTLADTMGSTRVFNESAPALAAALSDIAARGIHHVVLLGDYSDDGQHGAVQALHQMLQPWRAQGMQFYATFGNHDSFGAVGRDLTRNLTDETGTQHWRACSAVRPNTLYLPAMRGMSHPEAVHAMAPYSAAHIASALHWETPYSGKSTSHTRDASYLIEPAPDLWLLMIDANIFAPDADGVWQAQGNRAWDYVTAARPYLLDWIANVTARARANGKTLLTFSHYPALPLHIHAGQATGAPRWLSRMPSLAAGHALAQAGVGLHFSGHMHVAAQVTHGGLTNIAVPSPVAYPGAYTIATITCGRVTTHNVPLAVPDFAIAHTAYAAQDPQSPILAAPNYTAFLHAHLAHLACTFYMDTDWGGTLRPHLATALTPQATVEQALVDYYTLLCGGDLALRDISPARLASYRTLTGTPSGPLHRLAELLKQHLLELDMIHSKNLSKKHKKTQNPAS